MPPCTKPAEFASSIPAQRISSERDSAAGRGSRAAFTASSSSGSPWLRSRRLPARPGPASRPSSPPRTTRCWPWQPAISAAVVERSALSSPGPLAHVERDLRLLERGQKVEELSRRLRVGELAEVVGEPLGRLRRRAPRRRRRRRCRWACRAPRAGRIRARRSRSAARSRAPAPGRESGRRCPCRRRTWRRRRRSSRRARSPARVRSPRPGSRADPRRRATGRRPGQARSRPPAATAPAAIAPRRNTSRRFDASALTRPPWSWSRCSK